MLISGSVLMMPSKSHCRLHDVIFTLLYLSYFYTVVYYMCFMFCTTTGAHLGFSMKLWTLNFETRPFLLFRPGNEAKWICYPHTWVILMCSTWIVYGSYFQYCDICTTKVIPPLIHKLYYRARLIDTFRLCSNWSSTLITYTEWGTWGKLPASQSSVSRSLPLLFPMIIC